MTRFGRMSGNRNLASRASLIRSADVDVLTTLLLLRMRFNIKESDNDTLAEECVITGFRHLIGQEQWLDLSDSENLFETIQPSQNVKESEKRYWLDKVLAEYTKIEPKIESLARDKADQLMQSYERLGKVVKNGRFSIDPLFPVDLLGICVVLPEPEVG